MKLYTLAIEFPEGPSFIDTINLLHRRFNFADYIVSWHLYLATLTNNNFNKMEYYSRSSASRNLPVHKFNFYNDLYSDDCKQRIFKEVILSNIVTLFPTLLTMSANQGTILANILSQHGTTLTALDISSVPLSDDGFITIHQNMSLLPHLKKLSLNGQSTLSNSELLTLSNILSNLISLEELDLSNMTIGPQGENQLSAVLPKLTNLRKLDVSDNGFGGDILIPHLANLKNLTILNISNYRHRNAHVCVHKGYCGIGDVGVQALANNTTLTSLNLQYTVLKMEVGVQALARNTNLTELDLGLNFIADEGIQAFANNTTLTRLDLSSIIGFRQGLLRVFSNNTTLKDLSLAHNYIGEAGAQVFSRNTTLTSVNLSGSKIGDVGAQAFAKNTILKSLNLENNKIGDSGAQALANNTTLTSLNLMDNLIDESGKNALRNNSVTRIKF